MNPVDGLKGKVCVITGAGKGFGLDLAKLYNSRGTRLALITRSTEDVMALRKLFSDDEDDTLIFEGDVSDPETVEQFSNAIHEKFSAANILINNAGMRFRKPFLEIDLEQFNEVLACNLGSMFLMCRALIPTMKEKGGGKIINMSSVLGTNGLSDLSAYITSKAGIVGLTKSLAIEFAQSNINVNAIAPGFCKTSYYQDFQKNRHDLYQFTLDRTPMNRWGESREVSDVCLFLSSSMSDYITGQVLHVDGGWSAC
ncbi:MAG: beta-ketoacyl-ACP reductase [Legionellales bacterium]|nr:beta-ketoacyl-ACP reductase [Legionellales bacterium]|tara:strand:- start:35 stop:799 length:765 start_codon:yes stop_codon:yes gene_type:complete